MRVFEVTTADFLGNNLMSSEFQKAEPHSAPQRKITCVA
jgi:hypothetical protein